MQIKATSENDGKLQKIRLFDYFPPVYSQYYTHQVLLTRNLALQAEPEKRIFADCQKLETNTIWQISVYSDILLRAAACGYNFDSYFHLYGDTGNSIFVQKQGFNEKRWDYKVEMDRVAGTIRFFEFFDYPFEVLIRRQIPYITVYIPRLYTANMAEVEILSNILVKVASIASTHQAFDHYMSIAGDTGNPIQIGNFVA